MAAETLRVDVLVVGGGAAGAAAAWQAAALGATVLVAEPSPWLGGMITAAGVAAFDGNKASLASGFFRRLRDALEEHYGGPQGVKTAWVSDTCFEPRVGADLIARFVAESGAVVWHGAELLSVERTGDRIAGATFRHEGKNKRVEATITIEATEYGDLLHAAGVPYRLGRESRDELGEAWAPAKADLIVQDMTMVAILKKDPSGRARPVPRPEGYDPRVFDCSTSDICPTPDEALLNHKLFDWHGFITYGSLPRDKFMLNWPFHSNDSPDSVGIFGTPHERAEAIRRAKHRTLCYVHYMQNELGHPEWGLAEDEYGTPDHLPFIPYVRESRRVRGVRTMVTQDVVPVEGHARPVLRADSIAVGDYFLDHHHATEHLPPERRLGEKYPKNAPFQIPYPVTVPESVDGLLVTEKNISVSHIVNGCTRLQPVVMLAGQAVGAAAALCVRHGVEPRALDVAELRDTLLDARLMLYPIRDLEHTHRDFASIQRLCLLGLNDRPASINFEPDATMAREDANALATGYVKATGGGAEKLARALAAWHAGVTRGAYCTALDRL